MAKSGIKLDKNWKRFEKMIDPRRFDTRAKQQMRAATGAVALHVQKEIKEVIRGGRFKENAGLTLALKEPQTRPLAHTGRLIFPAVTHKVVDPFTAWIGIKATNRGYNIAKTVHDGVRIPVTPKMRRMFILLWRVSRGERKVGVLRGRAKKLWNMNKSRRWYPIGRGKTHILIPERPFMRRAFASKALHRRVQGIWTRAMQAALTGVA